MSFWDRVQDSWDASKGGLKYVAGPLPALLIDPAGVRKDLDVGLTALGLATAKYVGGPTYGLFTGKEPDYAAFDRGATTVIDNRRSPDPVPLWDWSDVGAAFQEVIPDPVEDWTKRLLLVGAVAGAAYVVL